MAGRRRAPPGPRSDSTGSAQRLPGLADGAAAGMRPSDYVTAAGWAQALRIWATTEHADQLCCCDPFKDCQHDRAQMPRLLVGRCRSGSGWFWTVREYRAGYNDGVTFRPAIDVSIDGRADTEAGAVDAIADATQRQLNGRAGRLAYSVQEASARLKSINQARRVERIAAKPASTETDAAPIEYLHSLDWRESDASWIPGEWHRKTYKVTRKTAKRVYYVKDGYRNSEGFVDRATLERDGKVELRYEYAFQDGRTLYAQPPPIPDRGPRPADLSALKRAMADAHPDRGGDRDTFQAARTAYHRAKAVAR